MIRVFLLLGILVALFAFLSCDVTACSSACGTSACCSGLAFGGIVHPIAHGISWMRHVIVTSAKAVPRHVRTVRHSVTTWMSDVGKVYRATVTWMRAVVRHVLTEVANLFVQVLHSVCSTFSEHVAGRSRS